VLNHCRPKIVGAGILALVFAAGQIANSTSIAPVKLEDLFKQADQVGVVRIVSGDSESYPTAVYKAVVENGYKGMESGQIIFFGPYDSYGIGNKYLLFLKKGNAVSPNKTSNGPYGVVPTFSTIMYAGYAALPIGYECVFDGHDVEQQCGDSVQLNPEQIILPSSLKVFPVGDATAVTNYKKWVRKAELLSFLRVLEVRNALGTPHPSWQP